MANSYKKAGIQIVFAGKTPSTKSVNQKRLKVLSKKAGYNQVQLCHSLIQLQYKFWVI